MALGVFAAGEEHSDRGDAYAQRTPVEMQPWVVAARPWHVGGGEQSVHPGKDEWSFSNTTASERTLMQALGAVPSLVMQESFGGFEPPRISVRGSGVQSAPTSRGLDIRLDGLPLGLADGSFQSVWLVPALAARGVVMRGGAAISSGAAAMGGVLDFSGLSMEGKNEVAGEAGDEGLLIGRAVWRSTKAGERALVSIHGQRQDGFRKFDEQWRTVVYGRVESGRCAITALLGRAVYGVPGPLTAAAASADPEGVSADVERDKPNRECAVARVSTQYRGKASGVEWLAGLAWLHSRDAFCQLRPNGFSKSRSNDIGFRGEIAGNSSAGPMRQNWHFQISAFGGWRNVERYVQEGGIRGKCFGDDRLFANTVTVAGEDRLELWSRTAVRFGISCLGSRRNLDGDSALSTGDLRWSTWRSLPYMAFEWKTNEGTILYVEWHMSGEAPTFDDVVSVSGTPSQLQRRIQSLDMQMADTWEIGSKGRLGRIQWNACTYRGRWSGELLRLVDANGVSLGTQNAHRTVHEGLEMAASIQKTDTKPSIVAGLKGVWQRAHFVGDSAFGDRLLGGVPRWIGRGTLGGEFSGGWQATAEVDWRGGTTFVDHAGKLGYGGSMLWSARFGRRHAWGDWHITCRNLFDAAHMASSAGVLDVARRPEATAIFLPGDGRTWSFGIDWCF